MDPLTAWALAVKAVAEMITEIVKGQPPEMREQAWKRWMEFDDRFRKLFKIDA